MSLTVQSFVEQALRRHLNSTLCKIDVAVAALVAHLRNELDLLDWACRFKCHRFYNSASQLRTVVTSYLCAPPGWTMTTTNAPARDVRDPDDTDDHDPFEDEEDDDDDGDEESDGQDDGAVVTSGDDAVIADADYADRLTWDVMRGFGRDKRRALRF
jgi:hypothetical protein